MYCKFLTGIKRYWWKYWCWKYACTRVVVGCIASNCGSGVTPGRGCGERSQSDSYTAHSANWRTCWEIKGWCSRGSGRGPRGGGNIRPRQQRWSLHRDWEWPWWKSLQETRRAGWQIDFKYLEHELSKNHQLRIILWMFMLLQGTAREPPAR